MSTSSHPLPSRRLLSALVLGAIALVSATVAWAASPPRMADETSYDALTYTAWGRQNNLSGAQSILGRIATTRHT